MLTPSQISGGSQRLKNGKLKGSDVKTLTSLFRTWLGSIASRYTIAETIAELDDADGEDTAAKMTACLNLIEESGFAVATIVPGQSRGGVSLSQITQRNLILEFAFGLIWDVPEELSSAQKRETPEPSVNVPVTSFF